MGTRVMSQMGTIALGRRIVIRCKQLLPEYESSGSGIQIFILSNPFLFLEKEI